MIYVDQSLQVGIKDKTRENLEVLSIHLDYWPPSAIAGATPTTVLNANIVKSGFRAHYLFPKDILDEAGDWLFQFVDDTNELAWDDFTVTITARGPK